MKVLVLMVLFYPTKAQSTQNYGLQGKKFKGEQQVMLAYLEEHYKETQNLFRMPKHL